MRAAITPYVAKAISSPLTRRVRRGLAARKARSNGTERQVDVYLNPRDPHGYLLLQVLPSLGERFDLTFRYHTVATLQDDMFPEQALWQSWAIADARDLARLYRLDFPDHDPALPEPAVPMPPAGWHRLKTSQTSRTRRWRYSEVCGMARFPLMKPRPLNPPSSALP